MCIRDRPHADLQVLDWRAAALLLRQGDIGYAEAYQRGWIATGDMRQLFTLAQRNREALERAVSGRRWALWLRCWVHRVLNDNSRRGSRRNISAHYDLGNDFYRLWLDEGMTYSAALFPEGHPEADAGADLQQLTRAQNSKYDRVLAQLNAQPGQTVLEIGCGWGGFAERAARAGLKVHGITLSHEQLAWAQARIEQAGLQDRVTLSLCDYRDVTQTFDHIVSIEMIEAVGEKHWPTYFSTLRRCLRPGGHAVIQAIDIGDERYAQYRAGTDFIQQYIFPGGMLPSPSRMREQCAAAGLAVRDALDFGLDYARTLAAWAHAFEAALPRVRALGYDERFVRLWRMYLVYCEVGFRERQIGVKHWTLA